MEVKELKSKGLIREFSITVSINDLKDKKIKKLQDIASKAKIDGFSPVSYTHLTLPTKA